MHKVFLGLLPILLCLSACELGEYYSGYKNLSKGEQWLSEHQYDSAEYYFSQNRHLEGDLNSYIHLAQVKALQGKIQLAQTYIDSANLSRESFDSFYLNNRGYVQNIIGDYDAALVSLYTAVELDPEMAYAHSNLGKTYLGLAELELAQRQLEIALTLDPEDPYTYHNFALLSAAKGDTISACEYLELAIQKNSSFILPIGKELKADHQRICR